MVLLWEQLQEGGLHFWRFSVGLVGFFSKELFAREAIISLEYIQEP
jgi:hypothetical protein